MLEKCKEFEGNCFDVESLSIVKELRSFKEKADKHTKGDKEDRSKLGVEWKRIVTLLDSELKSYSSEEKECIVFLASRSGFKNTGSCCSFRPILSNYSEFFSNFYNKYYKDYSFSMNLSFICNHLARAILSLDLFDLELFKGTFDFIDSDNLRDLFNLNSFLLNVSCPFCYRDITKSLIQSYRINGMNIEEKREFKNRIKECMDSLSLYERFVVCSTLSQLINLKVKNILVSKNEHLDEIYSGIDSVFSDGYCRANMFNLCKVMYELQYK